MWWAIAAVLLGIVEVFTVILVFGMVAVAALVAAALAFFGLDVIWQVVAFVVSAVALLALVRPVARRHLRAPPAARTGVAALVGSTAVVVERVDAHSGRIKLAGEIWSARAYDATQVIEPGATVDVIEIQGATALVYGSYGPRTL